MLDARRVRRRYCINTKNLTIRKFRIWVREYSTKRCKNSRSREDWLASTYRQRDWVYIRIVRRKRWKENSKMRESDKTIVTNVAYTSAFIVTNRIKKIVTKKQECRAEEIWEENCRQ